MSAPEWSELAHYEVDPATRDLLDLDFCLAHGVVVLGELPAGAREPIRLGMISPGDAALRAQVEERLGRKVLAVQLNSWEVRRALGRVHGVSSQERGIALHLGASRAIDFTPDRPAPELLDDLLSVAVQRGASDIHIEVYEDDVDLRFRIDGFLRQVTTPLSPENVVHVISRLKVVSEVDLIERRRAQDGHVSALYREADGSARRVDFRASFVPGPHGEDAVLRVLDPRRFRVALDELGMPAEIMAGYRRLIDFPDGLILVAGPTLSGKTNTLYATLAELGRLQRKIVTAEDPIEYEFPKVAQKGVTNEMGFADYMRAFLRQNPDVLLVGEIRDAETAETVVQAATTGHLVLSSVHTRSAATAITRLRTLGVRDDYIASILAGVLGQRLVPMICPACRAPDTPDPELIAAFYADPPAHGFSRGKGCSACAETGYRGMTGLFELLEMDGEVAAAIEAGATAERVQSTAAARGVYTPLLSDALDKVARGLTTLDQVARRVLPPFRPAWAHHGGGAS